MLRESGRLTEVVEIDGDVPDDVALEMEDCICAHLAADGAASPADVRAYLDAQTERPYHALALTQLLIVYHLLTAQCAPQEVAT